MSEPTAVTEREQRILGIIETARGKRRKFRDEQITMAHGAGGKATNTLIEGMFVPVLAGPQAGHSGLAEMTDAGAFALPGADPSDSTLALTTDSYVVRPLRFPGGSIGELAVNGTINDLSMTGARPLALSLSLILEEGLAAADLQHEIDAIARAAAEAGVAVVTGDTKVVERGRCDGMYITTSGVGIRDARATLSPTDLRPGDRILLSGSVGDHGMAIMLARGEFELDADLQSDTRCLWPAVDALLDAAGAGLHCLRDATRGGVASVLNELARASRVSMLVREDQVPVKPAVSGAAELLGIDPMYVANEGKLVAFVDPQYAEDAVRALRDTPGGEDAAVIGEVRSEPPGMVLVQTAFGGRRVMDQLVGDPLPRIC